MEPSELDPVLSETMVGGLINGSSGRLLDPGNTLHTDIPAYG